MTIIEYFIEKIDERGLSNKQVADLCGCDKSYISALKSGKRNIGENMFMRLCSALELDEVEARKEIGDQIAPRGYNHKNDGVKKKSTDQYNSANRVKRITKRDENDPAEMLINMMHIFSCKLNDDGKRVVMSIMKILTDIEAFQRNDDKEHEHEKTENEIQDR